MDFRGFVWICVDFRGFARIFDPSRRLKNIYWRLLVQKKRPNVFVDTYFWPKHASTFLLTRVLERSARQRFCWRAFARFWSNLPGGFLGLYLVFFNFLFPPPLGDFFRISGAFPGTKIRENPRTNIYPNPRKSTNIHENFVDFRGFSWIFVDVRGFS